MNTSCWPDWKVYLKFLIAVTLLWGSIQQAFADTTDARCDIYLPGSDKPLAQYLCVFSQRQGYITIERDDGVYYDFTPVGENPGNYQDSRGYPVYRQSGLGKKGLIFKLQEESIYVYWDTSELE